MHPINLYIHIPYCFAKCPYCGFFSCTNCEDTYEEYFNTLETEIITKGNKYTDREVKTIYIGGGTPNLVPHKYIVNTINNIKKNFHLNENIEITIEQYPQYITKESLKAYKQVGVNRISIGLQTTSNDQLKELHRRYTYEEFLDKYKLIKALGFNNIGIDLIFGYPSHTLKQWKQTLELITNLDVQHISCYSLEIEENTPYGILNNQGKLQLPSEVVDRQMYHYACKYLPTKGFGQYEISNFAKKGYECKHNLNFWNYQDYIGLGAGAYSRVDNVKSNNPENIQKYIKKEWDIQKEKLDDISIEKEKIILGLRLNKGITYSKELFQKEYMSKLNNQMTLNTKGNDFFNTVVKNML